MYRCNDCGEVFDHTETVTESRPLGAESYNVCPCCGGMNYGRAEEEDEL